MLSAARILLAVAAAAAGTVSVTAPAGGGTGQGAAGHYDHIFVIVEENHGLTDVIGNRAAPNLNALASRYGIATNYFAATHPSEPNYVALLGGSPFTVRARARVQLGDPG